MERCLQMDTPKHQRRKSLDRRPPQHKPPLRCKLASSTQRSPQSVNANPLPSGRGQEIHRRSRLESCRLRGVVGRLCSGFGVPTKTLRPICGARCSRSWVRHFARLTSAQNAQTASRRSRYSVDGALHRARLEFAQPFRIFDVL